MLVATSNHLKEVRSYHNMYIQFLCSSVFVLYNCPHTLMLSRQVDFKRSTLASHEQYYYMYVLGM